MGSVLKNFERELRYRIYHARYVRQVDAVLKRIELTKGKTEPRLIAMSDEYATKVLGWKGYAPWLRVYSAIRGEFKEGWVPDNYYARVVVPAINGEYGSVSRLKSLSRRLFADEASPDIAHLVNGVFYSLDGTPVSGGDISDRLFERSRKVVFKGDASSQGKGVYVFDRDTFDPIQIRRIGNGVFQGFIEQHDALHRFMPDSVVTLRLTTLVNGSGDPSLRASYLRIGRRMESHVKSESAIRVPIDQSSGDLAEEGYTTDWQAIDRHPDTAVVFAGKSVPLFSECVATVLRLHRKYPYPRCIGWDVTVDTSDAVQVMEWNGGHNDIKFSEVTQGPCFADMHWEALWRGSSQ